MHKILSVVGARPQFVKAAGLSKTLRHRFKEILVHTGQHYDYEMSQVFFDGLDIPKPDYDLGVGSDSHAKQTAKIMIGLDRIITKEKPDAILVYGDTNSTLAGAIVSSKMQIPLIHVEAGLRSYDKSMPEEINRIVADHIAVINFCPNRGAAQNLKKENITKNVYVVGNLMQEVLMNHRTDARKIQPELFTSCGIARGKYIFATIHRESNTDEKKILSNIVASLSGINTKVVWPLHPRTEKQLKKFGLMAKVKMIRNIIILPPVNYLESIALQEGARMVVTDSGGVQGEAFWLGVPCVTLRTTTEWPETVLAGANRLVDPARRDITKVINGIKPIKKRRITVPKTASRITKILAKLL